MQPHFHTSEIPDSLPVTGDHFKASGPQAEEIRTQMERMLGCTLFGRSPRLRSFLRYTVEQTLLTQHERLKEYVIAVEVFEKPDTFDPRLDSIVRVEARRLRSKVEAYYALLGRQDEVRISYRQGAYVPEFRYRHGLRDIEASASEQGLSLSPRVLLVSGNPTLTRQIQQEWSRYGYDLAGTVAPQLKAITTALAQPVDLVLLDSSGTDQRTSLLSLSRAIQQTGTPVICVTPAFDETFWQLILEMRPTACLRWPPRPGELRAVVQTAVLPRTLREEALVEETPMEAVV